MWPRAGRVVMASEGGFRVRVGLPHITYNRGFGAERHVVDDRRRRARDGGGVAATVARALRLGRRGAVALEVDVWRCRVRSIERVVREGERRREKVREGETR